MTDLPATSSLDTSAVNPRLAAELAAGLLPLNDILKRYELTRAELKLLLKDPHFRGMVAQYKRDWEAATNAKERIRLKAAIMVEENLMQLHQLFNDIDANPAARMDAFKQMVSLADVAPKPQQGEGGARFNLTLNLGGEQRTLVLDGTAETEETEKPEE